MKLTDYKEDLSKQDKGSPCYLAESSFDVRRVGSSVYQKEIDTLKKQLYSFADKDFDPNELIAHWLCEYGVTGWYGVLNPDETPLEYSKANARKVFLNPAYFLSLNHLLIQHGTDYANYLHDEMLEDIDQVKKS